MGFHLQIQRGLSASILLLCLSMVAFSHSTQADDPALQNLAEISSETTPQSFGEVIPCPEGYWIVSSWKSSQNCADEGMQFCPEVKRFDDGAGYRAADMDELTDSLIPGLPICVFVHGSFMDSPSVLPESRETWKWLERGSDGLPFQMIYFSWPSDRHLSALASIDVAILGNRASRNGFHLTSLIKKLPPESPVCLIGHSHGTRVISSSLHLLAGGTVEGRRHCCPGSEGRRLRAVYIASAIDHDWLNPGEKFDRALHCTECLINLRNENDPALMIYPLRAIGSSRALGCTGFTKKDRAELGRLSGKARQLDVSDLIGHGHLWPNYVRRPGLARTLRNFLYFADSSPQIVIE